MPCLPVLVSCWAAGVVKDADGHTHCAISGFSHEYLDATYPNTAAGGTKEMLWRATALPANAEQVRPRYYTD